MPSNKKKAKKKGPINQEMHKTDMSEAEKLKVLMFIEFKKSIFYNEKNII